MKKLIVILMLLFPAHLLAQEMVGVTTMSGVTWGDALSSCYVGTYSFAYDGDFTGDTDAACFTSGGANKQGTVTADTVSTEYIEYNAVDEYVTWAVAGEDGVSDEGPHTVFLSLYVSDDGDTNMETNALFEVVADADNNLDCRVADTGDAVSCVMEFQTTLKTKTSTVTLSFDTWYRVGYSWQTGEAGNDHATSVVTVGSEASWEEDDDDLGVWGSAPTEITVGEKESALAVNDTVRIKDVCILSGYKATDIF